MIRQNKNISANDLLNQKTPIRAERTKIRDPNDLLDGGSKSKLL
jgi:hypothetical protein